MQSLSSVFEEAVFNLIKQAAIYLPDDVKTALQIAYVKETNPIAKTQLEAILDNLELAEIQQAPICQDTGTITFYIKAGTNCRNIPIIKNALISAAKKATEHVPLRPNAVDPFTNQNSGDNVGRFVPQIHWELVEGNCSEVTVMLKGGGSENACTLGMLNPGEGLTGLKRFVIDSVIRAGAQPCPPTILGVAVGGGADTAMFLAKKALLRPLNEQNINPQAAELEKELLEATNMTGIGTMGLGGKTSVLGVHVDFAFRHPASFPVAVAFGCWATRRACLKICANNTVEFLTKNAGRQNNYDKI
ncbi:MAG: fumarate hydratase [Crenarchaeota archaeon]|nr:fumarate hydratase [Thermoproteota archaeon]